MQPILFPLLERSTRRAMRKRGTATAWYPSAAGRVHVYDAPGTGDAPPIVLLHGISATASSFAPLISRLRPHTRRVIALDFPGHGFSDPPRATLTPELLVDATGEVLA